MKYVDRDPVLFVRLKDDCTVNVADIEFTPVDGTIPSTGDFITQVDDDGFYYSIQIIERHRLLLPDRLTVSWCLVFRDVEDCQLLENLSSVVRQAFAGNEGSG